MKNARKKSFFLWRLSLGAMQLLFVVVDRTSQLLKQKKT
jgi:hypothetical protein